MGPLLPVLLALGAAFFSDAKRCRCGRAACSECRGHSGLGTASNSSFRGLTRAGGRVPYFDADEERRSEAEEGHVFSTPSPPSLLPGRMSIFGTGGLSYLMPGTTPASRLADLQKHGQMAYTAAASGQPGLAGPLGAQAYRTGFTMRALGEQIPESSWWAMKQAWPGETGRMHEWTPPAGRSGWGLWPEVGAGQGVSEDALEAIAEQAASESFGADDDEAYEPVGVGTPHLRGDDTPEVKAAREAAFSFDVMHKQLSSMLADYEERGPAVVQLWADLDEVHAAVARDLTEYRVGVDELGAVVSNLSDLYEAAATGLLDGATVTKKEVRYAMRMIRKSLPSFADWMKNLYAPVITKWAATLK